MLLLTQMVRYLKPGRQQLCCILATLFRRWQLGNFVATSGDFPDPLADFNRQKQQIETLFLVFGKMFGIDTNKFYVNTRNKEWGGCRKPYYFCPDNVNPFLSIIYSIYPPVKTANCTTFSILTKIEWCLLLAANIVNHLPAISAASQRTFHSCCVRMQLSW